MKTTGPPPIANMPSRAMTTKKRIGECRCFMTAPSSAGIEHLDRVAVADDWARGERLLVVGRRSAHLVTVAIRVQTPRRQWV
jgi:hypothetical protein